MRPLCGPASEPTVCAAEAPMYSGMPPPQGAPAPTYISSSSPNRPPYQSEARSTYYNPQSPSYPPSMAASREVTQYIPDEPRYNGYSLTPPPSSLSNPSIGTKGYMPPHISNEYATTAQQWGGKGMSTTNGAYNQSLPNAESTAMFPDARGDEFLTRIDYQLHEQPTSTGTTIPEPYKAATSAQIENPIPFPGMASYAYGTNAVIRDGIAPTRQDRLSNYPPVYDRDRYYSNYSLGRGPSQIPQQHEMNQGHFDRCYVPGERKSSDIGRMPDRGPWGSHPTVGIDDDIREPEHEAPGRIAQTRPRLISGYTSLPQQPPSTLQQQQERAYEEICAELRQALRMRSMLLSSEDYEFWDRQVKRLNKSFLELQEIQFSAINRQEYRRSKPSQSIVQWGRETLPLSAGHAERPRRTSFSLPSQRMVKVKAPADLPGGYQFKARRKGEVLLITVPKGGVIKGEIFSVPIVNDDEEDEG